MDRVLQSVLAMQASPTAERRLAEAARAANDEGDVPQPGTEAALAASLLSLETRAIGTENSVSIPLVRRGAPGDVRVDFGEI